MDISATESSTTEFVKGGHFSFYLKIIFGYEL